MLNIVCNQAPCVIFECFCIVAAGNHLVFLIGDAFLAHGVAILDKSPDELCGLDRPCFEALRTVWQMDSWLSAPLNRLGTLMGQLVEPSLSGVFHPTEAFGENMLILSQNEQEMTM